MNTSLVAFLAVFYCITQTLGFIDLEDDEATTAVDPYDMCFTSLDPEYIPPHEVTAKKISKHLLEQNLPDPLDLHTNKAPAAPRRPHDVIFVIDSSNSLRRSEFYRGIRALEWLINRGRANSQYAAVVFSYSAHVEFPFMRPSIARRLLRRIQFQAGRTNTQLGLLKAHEELLKNNRSGIRKKSVRKVVILSDGHSNIKPEKTLYNAFMIKMGGAEVFVIAVGKKMTGLPELMSMASTTNGHMFRVESMMGFLRVVKLIPRVNDVSPKHMEVYKRRMSRFRKQ